MSSTFTTLLTLMIVGFSFNLLAEDKDLQSFFEKGHQERLQHIEAMYQTKKQQLDQRRADQIETAEKIYALEKQIQPGQREANRELRQKIRQLRQEQRSREEQRRSQIAEKQNEFREAMKSRRQELRGKRPEGKSRGNRREGRKRE